MQLKQFQHELRKKKIHSALFISGEAVNPGFVYFTQLSKLTHSALLIPNNAKPTLFVSSLDYGRVKKEGAVRNVVLLKKPLFELLKRKYKVISIGIDFQNTPYSLIRKLKKTFPQSKLIDISPLLQKLREVKTTEELKIMKKAAEIANKTFNKIIHSFNFKTEAEVAAALEYEMAKHGASPAFPTIVASGKHAAIPHHVTTKKTLQKGFCVIDFGAKYKGYCSDCTRTVYLGKPTPREKKLYSLVLNAQQKALSSVRIGVSCKKLDSITRSHLKEYKKHFIHALGHGIGIEVHESPTISHNSKCRLKENMVVTIEPGIYVPNKFGIRIEDTVVVSSKPKVLTRLSKEFVMLRNKTGN